MAKTGRYQTWKEIESAMTSAGREGATQALSGAWVRFMLDLHCKLAHPPRKIA